MSGFWLLELAWAIFITAVRGLSLPFRCEPGDRPVVLAIWALSLLLLAGGGGLMALHLSLSAGANVGCVVAICAGVVGIAVLGHWGSDLDDIDDTLRDPASHWLDGS